MKPIALLGLSAFALAACAPARPASAPSPVPPSAHTTSSVETPDAARPDTAAAASTPSPAWWQLDDADDGVPGAGIVRAYRELLAGRDPKRTVVVAILDSGVDTAHVDLRANLWSNPGETPGNGLDDDGNGYVDDVRGWNFIGGPDGRHVNQDTYEVTRLYAACLPLLEARPDTLAEPARAEHERCTGIRRAFDEKRTEAVATLEQIRMIGEAQEQALELLRGALGGEPTPERVAELRPLRLEVARARQIYLQLEADGLSPEMLSEAREQYQTMVEYGLNPDFDPRHLVGDDYADPTERLYGNTDVFGPSAEHGTHVAGIVGAVRGNGIGVDGAAPAVRIMVVRTVPDGDERDKDVANAIRYAVDNGAHIINMSFGKAYSPGKRVVDDAVRHADAAGVLLVHAAGNDGADLASKPNYPNRAYEDGGQAALWIEVGASSPHAADSLAAPFSNFGKGQVDVFAPGMSILSTVPGDGYEENDGTSMAAPVVAGVAALIMAYYPELSAADVKRILLESATPFADRTVVRPGGGTVRFDELSATGGVVNAYRALKMARELAAAKK